MILKDKIMVIFYLNTLRFLFWKIVINFNFFWEIYICRFIFIRENMVITIVQIYYYLIGKMIVV